MTLFDKTAEHHAHFCQKSMGAFVDVVERLLLKSHAGENLIDLGCGTGCSTTVDWASHRCHMIGGDESAMMLAQAREGG